MIILIGAWWYFIPFFSYFFFKFNESDLELCNSALHPSSGLIRSGVCWFFHTVKYYGSLSTFSFLNFNFPVYDRVGTHREIRSDPVQG